MTFHYLQSGQFNILRTKDSSLIGLNDLVNSLDQSNILSRISKQKHFCQKHSIVVDLLAFIDYWKPPKLLKATSSRISVENCLEKLVRFKVSFL